MIYYLDASAWVKRYAEEPGSSWVVGLFRAAGTLTSGTVGVIEVLAALAQKERGGEMTARAGSQAREALEIDQSGMDLVSFSPAVFQLAIPLPARYGLRGCDAIHLACAMAVRAAAEDELMAFVTADSDLARAADGARFHVIDPASAADTS